MLYVYKIFRLILFALIITYFIGCFWYFFCTIYQDEEHLVQEDSDHINTTFIKYNNMAEMDDMHKLIVSCYFALTTLSTVGYGDYYYPVSNIERIVAVIIMLGGVAFFSYIMGTLFRSSATTKRKWVSSISQVTCTTG